MARAWLGTHPSPDIEASDIVQEALLKAHSAADQFRGETEQELAAWLLKACAPYRQERFATAREMRLTLEAVPLATAVERGPTAI